MTQFRVFPWKRTSEGALLIKKLLNAEWVDQRERVSADTVIINWGHGFGVKPIGGFMLNSIEGCCNAVSKTTTLRRLKNARVSCPEWTRSLPDAQAWVNAGNIVYGRETETGFDGAGIRLYKPGSTVSWAEFYTRRFPSVREFRINVVKDQAIDVLEKKRRIGSNPDPLIRCGDDWLYCRNNLDEYPDALLTQAIKAIDAVGLDFGGVDIGLDNHGTPCVFEVNTSPWLGPIIGARYAQAFKRIANELV